MELTLDPRASQNEAMKQQKGDREGQGKKRGERENKKGEGEKREKMSNSGRSLGVFNSKYFVLR